MLCVNSTLELNHLGWSRAMPPVIMRTPDHPELHDESVETLCRDDPAHACVFACAAFLSDNRADLVRIAVFTLVVECAEDAIAPREVGAYVHEHIPASELITLDATGHRPQASAPDATASAISSVARST
jgi:sigma-B regulation protein RsbQ